MILAATMQAAMTANLPSLTGLPLGNGALLGESHASVEREWNWDFLPFPFFVGSRTSQTLLVRLATFSFGFRHPSAAFPYRCWLAPFSPRSQLAG